MHVVLANLSLRQVTARFGGRGLEQLHILNEVQSFLNVFSVLLHLVDQGLKLDDSLLTATDIVRDTKGVPVETLDTRLEDTMERLDMATE